MDEKIKIQEIAEEAGMSNSEMINKAREIGFNVKAANSTVTPEEAGILMEYAMSGKLPSSLSSGKEENRSKEKKAAEEKKSTEKSCTLKW